MTLQQFKSTITDRVLHITYNIYDSVLLDELESRDDLTDESEYLQCAAIRIPYGKSFQAHRHIRCDRTTDMTQEAWVVLKGAVAVDYYDEEDNRIGSKIIEEGGVTVTFGGGHSYESLTDDTLVYEFKSGPYFGRDADKVAIENE